MTITRLKSISKIAFLLNLIDSDKLVEWACLMISKENYDDFFLELSTCKNDKDVLNTFGVLSDDLDTIHFLIDYFFGFFRDVFHSLAWHLIEEKMISFFRIVDMINADDSIKLFLLRLKDDYELRKEGFGGSMDMPFDLIDFLNQFSNFTIIQMELDKIGFPSLLLV